VVHGDSLCDPAGGSWLENADTATLGEAGFACDPPHPPIVRGP
jgi:hypothetical protein